MSARKTDRPVIHQEVVWIGEDRFGELQHEHPEHILRVWTVPTHRDPEVPPELPMTPQHRFNAFLEDYLHDWRRVGGNGSKVLKYGSRFVDNCVWVLVEYTNRKVWL